MEVAFVTQNSSLPILLASDFPILRDSLKSHFEQVAGITVVGCASNEGEVISLLQSLEPKLVVLDLNVEWAALCALLDRIHAASSVRSLIMSDVLDSSRVIEVLRHGAHGVVPRRTTQELLTKSIYTVLEGGFWVSRAMVADFVHIIRESGAAGRRSKGSESENENAAGHAAVVQASGASEVEIARLGLTKREVQIIGALVDGQTNKDIATTFGISEYTVKHHLTNIYDKLGVYNRVELVLFAINRGLCALTTTVSVGE
jgi:two-component system, NarL family, nitrate/nitrite response regulator NarL